MQSVGQEIEEETKERRLTCSYPDCGRVFKTRFALRRHCLIHTQEKKHECPYCGKRFALLQNLREHTYTHTQECPYVCGVAGCLKRFRQNGKLSLHRRTHPEYHLKTYRPTTRPKALQPVPTPPLDPPKSPLPDDKGDPQPFPPAFFAADEEDQACPQLKDEENPRSFKRQDTGPTCVPNDDRGPSKAALLPKLNLATVPQSCSTVLPEEGPAPDHDVLPCYLSCINSDFTRGLRPTLPLPLKLQKTKLPSPAPPCSLDLFELIRNELHKS